ncbi:MAG: hypothetical protein CMF98_03880 [Candidatus Marinimicrobia bacterium]|nr:hypothetical protein [Candidatus Neomarinimicrobiota bacterium]OUW50614.1 MAG: hypothetical protein CBD50_02475 [bacterium TMED190]|tara:strand:+ start:355 stop:1215 length:861 start_codon:yes stop_codon:yes gene_type:complete
MNKTNESTLFFEELKKLRISQDIELIEISNRTKINLEYLELIEKGDFDFLPYIYIRLFLKAYCLEIGSDINDCLNNLDKTMNITTHIKKEEPKVNITQSSTSNSISQINFKNLQFSNFNKKNLSNLLFLLLIVFFGIWIARNISKNNINNNTNENSILENEIPSESSLYKPNRINDSFLTSNYIQSNNISILDLNSPFELSLKSSENIITELTIDYTNDQLLTLLNDDNEIVKPFDQNFFLRLEKTKGIEIKINNKLIDIVKSNNPKDLIYNAISKELIIVTYLKR